MIPLSLVYIFIHRASHGELFPTIIIYAFHVFISGIYLDRLSTIPPGFIFKSLSVYSIYLYFNMTALLKKKKPSNWDSSQGDGFCLQLKARCESTRAQQLNVWQVRAAALVQQNGVDLGSQEGTEDAGRDQMLS